MDEAHLLHALGYVSLNPLRAKLVLTAQDWRWSSVAAHRSGKDDKLVKVAPILKRFGDVAALLGSPEDETAFKSLRQSEETERSLGGEHWIEQLEKLPGKANFFSKSIRYFGVSGDSLHHSCFWITPQGMG